MRSTIISQLAIVFVVILKLTDCQPTNNICKQNVYCYCSSDSKTFNCSTNKLGNKQIIELNDEKQLEIIDLGVNKIEEVMIKQDLNIKRLYLNDNKIKSIKHDKQFEYLKKLNELCLANNELQTIDLHTFDDLLELTYLNLSNAFSKSLANDEILNTHLCPLIKLKVLDLSGLNLNKLQLDCWKSTQNSVKTINLEELYLKNAKNIHNSWSNWFDYIGNSLKVLDLTNTNLIEFNANVFQHVNLQTLIVSYNKNLNKQKLLAQLTVTDKNSSSNSSSNSFNNLANIILAGINATSETFNLATFLKTKSNNIVSIDISDNMYNNDLNDGLIVDIMLKLKSFKANNNQFKSVLELNKNINASNLLKNTSSSDLMRLEELYISNNLIDSLLLPYIQYAIKLRVIDLSKNDIRLEMREYTLDKMILLFNNMPNITDINLSYNRFRRFITYFSNRNRTLNINLAHNNLNQFVILPKYLVEDAEFPSNIKLDSNENVELNLKSIDDETMQFTERYLNINQLDLSSNLFQTFNISHCLQSVKQLNILDLSLNTDLNKLDSLSYLSDVALQMYFRKELKEEIKINDKPIEWNQNLNNANDQTANAYNYKLINNNLFCINEVYFDNCKLDKLPSLEYSCIKKLSVYNNMLNNELELLISKFSLNYLKMLNLHNNNVTKLMFEIRQNDYLINKKDNLNTDLTFIDLKMNKYFECNCDLIKNIDNSLERLHLLTDCLLNKDKCNDTSNFDNINNPNGVDNNGKTSTKLSKKIIFFIAIICTIIGVVGLLILYSIFSDIRNLSVHNLFNCCKIKLFGRQYNLASSHENGSNNGDGNNRANVPYVRLTGSNDDDNNLEFGNY